MKKQKEELYSLLARMRSRIPSSHIQHMILSYIFYYCDKIGLAGNDSEAFNVAFEVVKDRLPGDLIYDLDEILDNSSIDEIRQIVYEVVQLEDKFIDKTNPNLSKLIIELLDLKNDDRVFDMGTGNGAFLANVIKTEKEKNIKMAELSGVEINVSQVYNSIMALEILSDDYLRKIRIDYGNVVTDKIKNHYNKGYAFAPFAMRLSGGAVNFKTIFKDIELTARNSSELIFIDKLIKNLEGEDRRAVALVHGRVLFNNSDREYRNEIVKSGLLEGIIELPGNLHNNTAIKSFLLIFSDNNKSVKFLDATDLTLKNINNPRNTYLDIESIVSIYHSNVVPQKAANELLEIQNWIPSNILLDVYKPENGVTLSEVAEVFSGSQYTQKRFAEMFTESESNYRILTSSDIEDGLINYENLKPFVPEDDRYDKFAVTVNDLIITSKSSVVKMAVVDDIEDEKIIVTGGMIIVRPKTEKLNSTFLKIFLESEQGQNIIKSIQKGITIVTLNAKDLANIIIPLPSINYQNKVAGKYNSKLAMLLAYKKEISNIENDLKNFYYEEVEVGNK